MTQVKHFKLKATSAAWCGAALLMAGVASADPLSITTTPAPATQNYFVGSDTLNEVVDSVLSSLRASSTVTQITTYQGLGSSQGERQLEGNPGSGEPACTPADANGAPELNPGCEEIAPMSRELGSSICDDEVSSGSNTTAEELAICADGIVVITDNASHRQYADSTATCPSGTSDNTSTGSYVVNATYAVSGKLRSSSQALTLSDGTSYTIGAGGFGWKDVLRLVYTGCRNDQGTCSAVDRLARCNSPARHAVVDNWQNFQETGTLPGDAALPGPQKACGTAACTTGVRQAYRRDDTSGTTGAFLGLLGLANNVSANLTGRTKWIANAGATNMTAIPSAFMFCDGGQTEGFMPQGTAGTDFVMSSDAPPHMVSGVMGDPIARTCASTDNLCAWNKTMGVVRAIRSGEGVNKYPPFQCTSGLFDYIQYMNSSAPVCPDGYVPLGGQCQLPYFNDTKGTTDPSDDTKHYNCLNKTTSNPPDVSVSNDGRAYNFVMKDDVTGAPELISTTLPQVAQWRQHMATVLGGTAGGTIPAANVVCEQDDATRNIGCIVGNTTCTIGFAGREAAGNAPYDDLQEPFRLMPLASTGGTAALPPSDSAILTSSAPDHYPLARDLYINAIGGFENIKADCKARNGGADSAYCDDEVALANEFYNMTALVQNACKAANFLPYATSTCRGATASAGCGAPTTQAHTACQPN